MRALSPGPLPVSNWLLFLLPSFIWGTTWLVIKFQLGTVAPEVSVAYRFALAAVLLLAWCRLRGISLRFSGRAHLDIAAMGLVQFGLNYVLVYLAEQHLTSGLVAVLFVLMVLWNLAGARIFFGTPAPWPVLLGAALGMLGVTLVFLPELRQVRAVPGLAGGVALALVATLVASSGNLLSQRLYGRGVEVVPSTAFAMLYGSAGVALSCLVRGIPFTFDPRPGYLASLAYLSVFGSVVAFVSYLTLLRRIGLGRAGYTAATIPVLAMLTSTLFEGYRWTGPALAGMGLVLLGNLLVMRARAAAAPTAAAEEAA